MIQKIGMIGVGRMGLAMARNLAAKGYPVTGYRRNAIDDFIAAGGIAATSSAEVVAAADIVFTSLPENAAVSDALNRTDGILAALKPGQIVVETTSLPPADKRIHAALVADAGAVMLDCPLSAARRACSKQAALRSSCRGTVRYPTTSTMYWKRSVRAARGSATSVRGPHENPSPQCLLRSTILPPPKAWPSRHAKVATSKPCTKPSRAAPPGQPCSRCGAR